MESSVLMRVDQHQHRKNHVTQSYLSCPSHIPTVLDASVRENDDSQTLRFPIPAWLTKMAPDNSITWRDTFKEMTLRLNQASAVMIVYDSVDSI